MQALAHARPHRCLSGGLCLAVVILAGCATRPPQEPGNTGRVAYQSIEPEGGDKLRLSASQSFVAAIPRPSKVLPTYPEAWLASRLAPVSVCAELFIDGDGRVYESHPLTQGDACPALASEYGASFQQAVLAAVSQWQFIPSYVCEFPAGVAPEAVCVGEGVVRKPLAIRQAYRFVFRQTPQGPVVDEAGAMMGRR